MSEWLLMAAMGGGGALWAIGGTGYKWARRLVLPLYLAGIALLSHVLWWKATLACLLSILAFSLGYGEGKTYLYRFAVGIGFVVPTMIIHWSLWQAIVPVVWITLFALSNWPPTERQFPWKIVEYGTGCIVSIAWLI
jgi:hypothetical protein